MKPKLLISIFLSISLLSVGIIQSATTMNMDGSIETPFGGMWSMTWSSYVCDCNYANVHEILDYKTMSYISLYKAPQSIFYSYYNGSGLYQLGTHTTNTQDCMMWVYYVYYYECETVWYNDYDYGSIPGTGTTEI